LLWRPARLAGCLLAVMGEYRLRAHKDTGSWMR
jgi:hypothetical protein